MKLNPYIAGNPVGGGDAFIGRTDVLREVVRVLRSPGENALVLYGQRRIGKTSVLQELIARLPTEGPYRPVFFDLQDKAALPLGQVLQELAARITDNLELPPSPTWTDDAPRAFRADFIPQVLAHLPADTSLVLLFDEFDVLDTPGEGQAGTAFFPYLRGLLSLDPRLQFIFVIGRRPEDLSSLTLSIFKGVKSRSVSLMSPEETANLVRLAERNKTLCWSYDAIAQVYALTGGHPFLTQQLCQEIWEQAYQDEPEESPSISPAEVEAAATAALRSATSALEWLWDGLKPAQRVVASTLAGAGSTPISQRELEQRLLDSGVRILIDELQDAPRVLQEWDLIEPVEAGYQFRVELLRRWLAERKPLPLVQKEIDQILPVAENLFQAAYGLYQGGSLQQAIELLRQAIGLNPNHLRANQLLAELLLAQGELIEAQQLLESLYQYHPAAARPRLVQALLLQARKVTEEEQLTLYERVLQLEPNQAEAVNGKQQIWLRRGDEDLARNNLDKALRAYRQANLSEYVTKVEALLRRRRLEDAQREMGLLQGAGKYAAALGIAKQLHQDYPEERDSLPDLELLERKTKLDDLYQRAVGALQANDRGIAQKLLAEVVSLEPTYQEATRNLHKAVTGLDVEELQLEVEVEKETWQQKEAKAQDEINAREKKIKLLQERLDTEKETRQQVEVALQKETQTRHQNQEEIAKLHHQLEAESNLRKRVESDTQQEIERRRTLEIEVAHLQGQLKTEIEIRQKAEATVVGATQSVSQLQTKVTQVEVILNTERSAWKTAARTSSQKISMLILFIILACLALFLSWLPSLLSQQTVTSIPTVITLSTLTPSPTSFLPVTSTPAIIPVSEVKGVAKEGTRLRSGPDRSFSLLKTLSSGTPVTAIARNGNGDWVFVRLSDNTQGWISLGYVEWNGDISALPTRD